MGDNFKVGDRVRVIDLRANDEEIGIHIGMIGTVSEKLFGPIIAVWFSNYTAPRHLTNVRPNGTVQMWSSQLERAPKLANNNIETLHDKLRQAMIREMWALERLEDIREKENNARAALNQLIQQVNEAIRECEKATLDRMNAEQALSNAA